jgi:hypothetical protein
LVYGACPVYARDDRPVDPPREQARHIAVLHKQGIGFRARGSDSRVQGSRFRVESFAFRVMGLGLWIQG